MQRQKASSVEQLAGLEVLPPFEDIDISGKSTMNRPGYRSLMERLEAGDVRYVVAYDLSRITRTLADQQDFFEALRRVGADFIESATGHLVDPQDEDQELSANVLGSVNQHARKKTARRVRDSFAAKIARGDLVGPVPAGFVRKKEVLPSGKIAKTWVEPDPVTAPVILRIFADYATGSYSLKQLARRMNEEGIKPPRSAHFRNNRAPAQLFTADVLKDIISNPRYAGQIPRKDGTVHKAAYAPLVDDEIWSACLRVRFQHRRVRSSGKRRRASPYLLSGVLRCARCGSTMSGQTWKPDRTHPSPRCCYTCYLRRTAKACSMPSLAQEGIEDELLAILREVAMPGGLAEAVDAALAT
ncbi:MAG: recombinase family protein, partial [Acidimicrobiia bacterium]